jgi:VanZ family protein
MVTTHGMQKQAMRQKKSCARPSAASSKEECYRKAYGVAERWPQRSQEILGYWIPALAWATLVLFASVTPQPEVHLPVMPSMPGTDKVAHLVMYGILAVLFCRAFRQYTAVYSASNAVALALITSNGYGFIIECYQYVVPFRSFEGLDLVANALGSLSALLVWSYFR